MSLRSRPERVLRPRLVVVRRARVPSRPDLLALAFGHRSDGMVFVDGWQWRCRECVNFDADDRLVWHHTRTQGAAMNAAQRHVFFCHDHTLTVRRSPVDPRVEMLLRNSTPVGAR